ncbi:MAG: hypothetical protein QM737_12470 [Ferruginibacter sp.]
MKQTSLVSLVSLLMFLYGELACAQEPSTIHPSPNIGWLLSDVNQSNDLFVGSSRLTIPVCELAVGAYKFPVTLNYTNKSVPVDQIPSWVGLGWDLQAGGQVTRIVRGKPDELRETKSYFLRTVDIGGNGYPSGSSTQYFEVFTEHDFAYINNYGKLNVSNWNTSGYLFGTLNSEPALEVMPSSQITTNYTTNQTTFTDLTSYDNLRNYDYEADEFNFNVAGFSGKFYLNHLGNWICESSMGNCVVVPEIGSTQKGVLNVPRLIYRITIIAPDGIKYTFGGTTSDKLANVEFWRGPTGYAGMNSSVLFGDVYLNVVPNAWHLTKIETPDNRFIDLFYTKGKLQLMNADAPWGDGTATSFNRSYPGSLHRSMAEPWYLTTISTSEGNTIEFSFQNSQQLGTDKLLTATDASNSIFVDYADISADIVGQNNNMQKLTGIKLKSSGNVVKSYQFGYIENLSERLKLNSFKEMAPDGSAQANATYTFQYNAGLLPDYASGKVDHFGFFNNTRYFTDNTTNSYSITRAAFEAAYMASRAPNFTYSKYETLDKVYFPTGGYRKYTYEANDYSSSITQWPFAVTTPGANANTGGIRVSKITDYNADGTIVSDKEYIYKTTLTGTVSSGILSIPTPNYFYDGAGGTYTFSTRSFIPLDRARSHITYSTVFEKNRDGSYVKYDYYGYNTANCNDAVPMYENNAPAFVDRVPYTDNNFKRGLVKTIYYYNTLNSEVKRDEFKYQDQYEPNSTRYIRSVRLKRGDPSSGAGYRSSAYAQYYFPNHQRYKKDVITSTAGTITTEINNTYDSYNRLSATTVLNSKGETISVTNKFVHDFSTTDPYDDMITKNIITPVIEETVTNVTLGKEISKTKTNYQWWNSNTLIAPATVAKSLGGNPLEVESTIGGYDTKANITQYTKKDAIVRAVFWGYNGQYPIAEVTNIPYSVALSASAVNTYTLNNSNTTDNVMRTELNKIRNAFSGNSSVSATTYTYKPLVGMSSETDVNGKTTYYQYDLFNRLSLIRDQDKNILKKYCYNLAGQVENCASQSYTNTFQQVTLTSHAACVLPGANAPTYTTSAAAGTYTSYISQEDANQMAIDAITLSGQPIADALPCNYWKIYLTNNSGYTGYTFPMYIDGVLYNFPANGVSNVQVANILAGNHVFMFPCGPTSSFAMSPLNGPIPASCGTNFTLAVNSNITFSFYPVWNIACSLTASANPLSMSGFCSTGAPGTTNVYSTSQVIGPGSTLYYDAAKTQRVNNMLWVRPWSGTGKVIYAINSQGVVQSTTYSQNCP